MTQQKIPSRIPHEEVDNEIQPWSMPTVEDRNAPPKKAPPFRSKQAKEKIEEVSGEVEVKPITAGQLQEMAEQIEKEAFEKGYQDGLKIGKADGEKQGLAAGKKQAYKEHTQDLENKKQRLGLIADTLFDPMSSQEVALENVVLDLAMGVAKHLLNKQLDIDPKAIFPIVERSVASLPAGAKNIRVYLNPDDIELVREVSSAVGKHWQIFPDADLDRGGCRVETDESLVDFSIQKRLEMMISTVDENDVPKSVNLSDVEDYRPVEEETTEAKGQDQTEQDVSADNEATQIETAEIESAELVSSELESPELENSKIENAGIESVPSAELTSSSSGQASPTDIEQKQDQDGDS